MILIPKPVYARYIAHMKSAGISESQFQHYVKWVRYFLDFCAVHVITEGSSERVRQFLDKLLEKRQSDLQIRQAEHAVRLYIEINGQTASHTSIHADATRNHPAETAVVVPAGSNRKSQFNEAAYEEKSDSPEWDAVIGVMADEIRVRHYSRKTLKTYANWSRQFQRFLKNKPPHELSGEEVKAYMTHLAVKCQVASTTQNQAFNSLLFLYRHGLKREFGELHDVPRAKKSLYVPVDLSRPEIDAILGQLYHPHDLIVKLLFGCGLRLFECLQLRVRDFNFDAGILTIHGKGKKDRTVPLPESINGELQRQIQMVKALHEKDLAEGYNGVFLEDAMEKKYPKAPKDLIHQWFFPQRELTRVEETGQLRRAHVHESLLQKALYITVRKAGITKKVTAHTFRHSYATHLLQANYDIRTIQTMLGHSSLKTTMIYTHCVPVRTLKEAKSPLDLD